jgi:hypothetical protein
MIRDLWKHRRWMHIFRPIRFTGNRPIDKWVGWEQGYECIRCGCWVRSRIKHCLNVCKRSPAYIEQEKINFHCVPVVEPSQGLEKGDNCD